MFHFSWNSTVRVDANLTNVHMQKLETKEFDRWIKLNFLDLGIPRFLKEHDFFDNFNQEFRESRMHKIWKE